MFPRWTLVGAAVLALGLQVCSSVDSFTEFDFDDDPGTVETDTSVEAQGGICPNLQQMLSLPNAPANTLRLNEAGAVSPVYDVDALRMPTGQRDGYLQASNGAFLQCLVAWGPREAWPGISTGWQGRLFIRFRAPDWPVVNLVDQTDLTVTIDQALQRTLPLEGSGDLVWSTPATTSSWPRRLPTATGWS